MLLSWLRPRRAQATRPVTFRPNMESLDDRIVPANPHFLYADSSIGSSYELIVDFKEAGLGNNQLIDYELTGDASATFGYMNKGGNIVQGTPWLVEGDTLATGTFSSDKNGNITETLTSDAPVQPTDLKTPKGNGWTQLVSVSYTNLTLTDVTNGESIDVPDASYSNFPS